MSQISLGIVIIVVSDSRNEQTDKSGKVLEERINKSGHKLVQKIFLKDNVEDIKSKLLELINSDNHNVVILSGGTGLTGRDSTPEAVKAVIKKEIPGFGEIFRMISYDKIATSSLQSRAMAGLADDKFIFALPGSPGACKDAWDNILVHQLNSDTKPCNLVELIPRLREG
ncbi:MAG: molybdenum cofactor biosynthesis protein [Rickettsiales bacterium]|nr:molybdenum cofactor biosynthesis protein [Rickettsiales bacterium]OUT43660.1 MAG: molybdenum cofactor biosynthesis protein [Pelagibacteraceae bacterium TMED13]|tara:strand:+ start:763 stop:1272 length:510 start_codon:yes stop_codon:yes gene_type:complete